jgi:hypothetical protein
MCNWISKETEEALRKIEEKQFRKTLEIMNRKDRLDDLLKEAFQKRLRKRYGKYGQLWFD